jgi:hypothetical protein
MIITSINESVVRSFLYISIVRSRYLNENEKVICPLITDKGGAV